MAYQYPTKREVEFAMEEGWSREDAERGFTIFNFDGLNLFEIECIYDAHNIDTDGDDDEAAMEAERIGFCKIIPINELPDPFIINGSDRRFFGWVDTPENRKAIEDWCENYNY